MVALNTAFMRELKQILEERFVPYLRPLLGVQGSVEDRRKKQISRAFSGFVIHKKFDIDPRTATQLVVDDYDDNGIDAFYYSDDEKTLYLIQSKLKESEAFNQEDALKFLVGTRKLLDKDFDSFNQNVKDQEQVIDQWLDECEAVKLLVAYTGDAITLHAQQELLDGIQSEIDNGEELLKKEIVEIASADIQIYLTQEHGFKRVNEKLVIEQFRVVEQPRKVVYGLVALNDFVNIHNTHGKALFEKNIRYFLGAGRRGVNSAIKETLVREPENFSYLNNGVTMIADSIGPGKSIRGSKTTKKYEALGLSVVNGAQTISSVAQFVNENPGTDITQAKVAITLIQSNGDDFDKKVTRARNLQNPVDLAHFAALDDLQERLRKEIAVFGFEYHYRPQQLASGTPNYFDISTLSKALACLYRDNRYPARLKTEPSQFVDFESDSYKSIFTADLSGVQAINAVKVFTKIQSLLLTQEKSQPSPERLVYRHFLYPLASLIMKRFKSRIESDSIILNAQVDQLLSAPFDTLRQAVHDEFVSLRMGSAHHSFFKRVSDTAKLMQYIDIKQLNLNDDSTVQSLIGRTNAADSSNNALSNFLVGKLPQLRTE
ncbi:MAG: AIPR family protein [Thiotrichales bacterium]|nr:AIPR family protein [Thiotrichales bacterium]